MLAVVFVYHRPQFAQGYGVVKGVLYVEEDSSVLIDDRIVKEGEIIYGVKVVKIDKNEVEFSKTGKTWKQRVKEKPNPAWNSNEER